MSKICFIIANCMREFNFKDSIMEKLKLRVCDLTFDQFDEFSFEFLTIMSFINKIHVSNDVLFSILILF
jgi:hypothetical protein